MPPSTAEYDVAVIGGGPAGSTVGSMIRRYNPDARILILEREKFPRDHVGESQLPAIGPILHEIGAWDKVEAADFPIKVGATYRWGKSRDLWDFEFLPLSEFRDEPRPAKYQGQRLFTAFQVDRARYDDILLRHAESLGCEVREETRVARIGHDNGRITGLELDTGETITAKHYIDASGQAALLRRALDIPAHAPKKLRGIAIWDHWHNADWAVKIGVGGTRVQILSINTGWIWFIPLGPTRTSIGYICPVDHYKHSGLTPEQLYNHALAQEPRIQTLIRNGHAEGNIRTTKDWSNVADRLAGENWFLVGESAGFADPILAAGLTLAHRSAKEAAYIILDDLREKPDHDQRSLRAHYDESNRARIKAYIRFAEFWYAANGQFTDLQQYTTEIAKDAGLKLSPRAAFRWLSLGGFGHEDRFFPGVGGLDIFSIKEVARRFTTEVTDEATSTDTWEINQFNVFKLNLVGAQRDKVPVFRDGRILMLDCYRRGHHMLPMIGAYETVVEILRQTSDGGRILQAIQDVAKLQAGVQAVPFDELAIACLETMLGEGWIQAKLNKNKPRFAITDRGRINSRVFHANRDPLPGSAENAAD